MVRGEKLKPLIRISCFLLCLLVVFQGINRIVSHPAENRTWLNTYRVREIYNLPDETIDVIGMGSSVTIMGFHPMFLYDQYGISAYNAGIEQQPMFQTYLMLSEMLKTQTPKVVLIETQMLTRDQQEPWFRKTFDNLKWSKTKLEMLYDFPEEYFQDSKLSYFFPILKYHNRYTEISEYDFTHAAQESYHEVQMGSHVTVGGYVPSETLAPLTENPTEYAEFDERAMEYLEKILLLCQEYNVDMVLYKTPIDTESSGWWSLAYHNTMQKWADEHQVDFIDFNMEDVFLQCQFNYAKDLIDMHHANYTGAEKISRYLGEYLCENYSLVDRRGDENYTYLEGKLEAYQRAIFKADLCSTTNLTDYLNQLIRAKDDDYTVIISAKDEVATHMGEELGQLFHSMGFHSNLADESARWHSFIGIWCNGTVEYESFSEGIDDPERDLLTYNGVLPDSTKYTIKSAGWSVGNLSNICIDGKEYSKNKRGLNIVVYDNKLGYVIDSVVFDTWSEPGTAYSR